LASLEAMIRGSLTGNECMTSSRTADPEVGGPAVLQSRLVTPHSLEAECSVLGAVLVGCPRCNEELAATLSMTPDVYAAWLQAKTASTLRSMRCATRRREGSPMTLDGFTVEERLIDETMRYYSCTAGMAVGILRTQIAALTSPGPYDRVLRDPVRGSDGDPNEAPRPYDIALAKRRRQ
jgi:hypothetical protein